MWRSSITDQSNDEVFLRGKSELMRRDGDVPELKD